MRKVLFRSAIAIVIIALSDVLVSRYFFTELSSAGGTSTATALDVLALKKSIVLSVMHLVVAIVLFLWLQKSRAANTYQNIGICLLLLVIAELITRWNMIV